MNILSQKSKVIKAWQETTENVASLAYRFKVSPQTIRNWTTGISGPKRDDKSISQFHRNLGINLIAFRTSKRISRAQLAVYLGTSTKNLSAIEKGKTDATIGQLKHLADSLEIRLSELISDLDA